MILSTHALVGAALGSKIQNLFILIPLVLAMHYFLDGFLHGEYIDDRKDNIGSTWWKVSLDLIIGLIIIFFFIFSNHSDPKALLNILLGALFSMFPDLLTVIFYWRKDWKIINKIKAFHSWAHRYGKNPKYSPERQWTLRNYANDFWLSILSMAILFF